MDNNTIYEILLKNEPSKLQPAADESAQWALENKTAMNPNKTKELYITFSKSPFGLHWW